MGDGFLQVKRPNRQYQSTEGDATCALQAVATVIQRPILSVYPHLCSCFPSRVCARPGPATDGFGKPESNASLL